MRLLPPRATALRLGEGGQTCLAPRSGRTGPWGLGVVRSLRGGAEMSEDSEDDLDTFNDEDFDDGMLDEEDFGEANFIERLQQDWRKTPVITRTFFQVSIGIAVFTAVFNANEWPSVLLLDWGPTIFKLQLWRLFTPFLYLGPLGLNFLLTAHFSWTYMSQLEKLHYREPHTFAMLLGFGMFSLLLLTLVTGADVNSSYTLGHSLSCFLVMVWSRKFAGTKVNVLDMFELSTELLPYFFVAQTLMMEGVVPWVDLSGLLIGYAWQTLSLKGLLQAPKPLKNFFRNNAFLRAEYARAGKEYGQELPAHDEEDTILPSDASEEEREEEEEGEEEEEDDSRTNVEVTPVAEKEEVGRKVSAHVPRTAESATGLGEGEGSGEEEEDEEEDESEEDESEEEEVMEQSTQSEERDVREQSNESEEEEGSDGTDGTTGPESEEEDEQEGVEYDSEAEYEAESDDGEQGGASGGEVEEEEEESLFEEELGEFDEEMENMLDEFEDEMDGDEFSGSVDVSEEEDSLED